MLEEIIETNLILNGFTEDMVFDRAQCHGLIYVANSIYWDKGW